VIDNINWKFVSAVSIVAMAVSLLSGGLGGIPFGVLVLRAFIGGGVFLILAVALNLLIVRFFPEILDDVDSGAAGSMEKNNAGSDAEADELTGSRVDIVLPSEPAEPVSPVVTSVETSESDVVSDGVEKDVKSSGTAQDGDLGNIDRFSGAFSEVDDDISGADGSASGNAPGGDHDPEEIAQAIHTVIKRDEKG